MLLLSSLWVEILAVMGAFLIATWVAVLVATWAADPSAGPAPSAAPSPDPSAAIWAGLSAGPSVAALFAAIWADPSAGLPAAEPTAESGGGGVGKERMRVLNGGGDEKGASGRRKGHHREVNGVTRRDEQTVCDMDTDSAKGKKTAHHSNGNTQHTNSGLSSSATNQAPPPETYHNQIVTGYLKRHTYRYHPNHHFSPLPHVKNAILILSNIGVYLRLPNRNVASLVIRTLADVIASAADAVSSSSSSMSFMGSAGNGANGLGSENCYVGPALEALSKITLLYDNHAVIAAAVGKKGGVLVGQQRTKNGMTRVGGKMLIEILVEGLLDVLGVPTTPSSSLSSGYGPEDPTSSPSHEQLALWESVLLNMSNLASINDEIREAMVRIPGFVRRMLSWASYGPSNAATSSAIAAYTAMTNSATSSNSRTKEMASARALLASYQHNVSLYTPLAQRAMRTLAECAKADRCRDVLKGFEEELMVFVMRSAVNVEVTGMQIGKVDEEVGKLAAECLFYTNADD
ncbi:hypothetical protein HK102_007214 [Quaeritorhiza haematococci]|nr:hypothetical protein HK102_007214 [Quaeritorhiza haematococci]